MQNQVLMVEGLSGDGGVGSSVIPLRTNVGCDSNVPEKGGVQRPILSTKTCQSCISSIVDCHIDGHSNTMSGVQHSSGVILPRVEVDDGTVLLLVKVLVLLVHGVLRVPAITHIGHHPS
jgi:hypothetical protein